MENSLVIFQERGLLLGLYPSDFETYFQISSAWISPSHHSMLIWNFERVKEPTKGSFIHAGALLGNSPATFNAHGYIFIKKINKLLTLGLFLSEIVSEMPLKKIGKKIEIDQFNKLPSDIPQSIFRFVQRIKRKNILIIDPLMLFQAYDVI